MTTTAYDNKLFSWKQRGDAHEAFDHFESRLSTVRDSFGIGFINHPNLVAERKIEVPQVAIPLTSEDLAELKGPHLKTAITLATFMQQRYDRVVRANREVEEAFSKGIAAIESLFAVNCNARLLIQSTKKSICRRELLCYSYGTASNLQT